ncbi:MAG: hypothetical protein ACLRWP_16285 [Bilophila wadsworthia]
MIVKKFKRTSFKKSKSVMIGGLVDYIRRTRRQGQDSSPMPEAETSDNDRRRSERDDFLQKNPSEPDAGHAGFCHGRKTNNRP